jgi:beta-mannosidase
VTARVHSVAGHERVPVTAWRVCATPPGAADGPVALARCGPHLVEAAAPTTAAAALRAAGAWSLDGAARRFDAEDWWFATTLPAVAREDGDELALVFDGIATVADVWLDGAPLLTSDNMFARHVRAIDRGGGELVIRCRALDPLLAAKRPRPRWRAPMIEHQQLRWWRTTLLGRTPGWSPPAAAVGPWRPVTLERRVGVAVDEVRLSATLSGNVGRVDVTAQVRALGRDVVGAGVLVVARNGVEHRVALEDGGGALVGKLELRDPERWWPHTHGEPALYEARLELGDVVVALGRIGFREVERRDEFALHVNGVRVFCRGACWTPLDPVALAADRDQYSAALNQARAAGMNMLRVGGTMVYESDDFYELCDELGVLVWQDFMFANMDYPEDDAGFVDGVREEAKQQLLRLQARPSVAVLCGNSEGEQQAALPRRALLAIERARRRLPAPAERRHDVVLRRRRVPLAGHRCAARRGALRLGVSRLRQRARAARAARRSDGARASRRVEGAHAARPRRRLGLRRRARSLPRRALWRRAHAAALCRSRALPRAVARRHRRGHGRGVRRVAHAALDLRRRARLVLARPVAERGLGRGRR